MGIPYLGISDEEQFDILLVKYPILISAWLILAIAPRWKYTVAIASHVALFYGLVYVAILADSMFLNPVPMETPDWTSPSLVAKLCAPGESKCVVGPDKIMELFMSLDGVHLLFSTKGACFGGWVHYCVFDLLAGTYIVKDSNSKRHVLPQLLLLPTLFFTMMFGPAGFVLYSLIALIWPVNKDKAE